MRQAFGKEQRFLELSYENKELLFRGMLRVRAASMRCTAISAPPGKKSQIRCALRSKNLSGWRKRNSAISVQLQGGGPSCC